MTELPAPEFSHPVPVDRIGATWSHFPIEAGAEERAALAKRFDLVELGRLKAVVRLRRVRAGSFVKLAAEIEAAVVQTCVVSLEPVPAAVSEKLELLFGPIEGSRAERQEIEVSADLDEPEPIEDGVIDIGEIVAQQLSLALDPYPRRDDAVAETVLMPADTEPEAEPARPNPFADLAGRIKPR